jgi:cysteine synthase A
MSRFEKENQIAEHMNQLIGNTPMVFLSPKVNHTKARIALKLESENPMASVKDRLAYSIIREAEKEGKITPGKSVLVEATSGNTGIALAQLGASRGYKVILTMPDTMSQERRALLTILGAELHLTPGAMGMKGALAVANKLAAETPDSFMCNQFSNPANSLIHRETTGPEVWRQTDGKVDYFLAGVGTGGTISGVGQYLKSVGSKAECYAIEPVESPVLSGGKPSPHKIAGIGAGFVPEIYDPTVVAGVLQVSSDDALAMTKVLPREEGIFCGISGGAAVTAALKFGARPENEGKLIVVIVPSFGERYLSTAAFSQIRDEVAKLPTEQVQL